MSPKQGMDLPEVLTLRLEERTRRKLEEMARGEERSVGAMARIILREGIEAREAKKGKKKPA